MIKDTHDLYRVKNFLKSEPDCEVIIISNKRIQSEEYWKRIEAHLGIKKRPWIVTNSNTWDGLTIIDSLVLKIGRWWENRNAIDFLRTHTKLAKMTLPITYIPPFVKGGEED